MEYNQDNYQTNLQTKSENFSDYGDAQYHDALTDGTHLIRFLPSHSSVSTMFGKTVDKDQFSYATKRIWIPVGDKNVPLWNSAVHGKSKHDLWDHYKHAITSDEKYAEHAIKLTDKRLKWQVRYVYYAMLLKKGRDIKVLELPYMVHNQMNKLMKTADNSGQTLNADSIVHPKTGGVVQVVRDMNAVSVSEKYETKFAGLTYDGGTSSYQTDELGKEELEGFLAMPKLASLYTDIYTLKHLEKAIEVIETYDMFNSKYTTTDHWKEKKMKFIELYSDTKGSSEKEAPKQSTPPPPPPVSQPAEQKAAPQPPQTELPEAPFNEDVPDPTGTDIADDELSGI